MSGKASCKSDTKSTCSTIRSVVMRTLSCASSMTYASSFALYLAFIGTGIAPMNWLPNKRSTNSWQLDINIPTESPESTPKAFNDRAALVAL